jgi:hypothetical protein
MTARCGTIVPAATPICEGLLPLYRNALVAKVVLETVTSMSAHCVRGTLEQVPVVGSQVPLAWQTSICPHATGLLPVHAPPAHA